MDEPFWFGILLRFSTVGIGAADVSSQLNGGVPGAFHSRQASGVRIPGNEQNLPVVTDNR